MSEAIFSIVTVCGLLVLSQLSPGPDVFFVFRTALSRGFRAGCAVATGINAGFLLQALVVAAVGGWVMEQSWSYAVLVVAACWLLYLAYRIFPRHWRGAADALNREVKKPEGLFRLAVQGGLCNVLNPKCTLFICGLLLGPQREFSSVFPWFTPVILASFFAANEVGWSLWCALLQIRPVRRFYLRYTAAFDALFAVLLAAFALLLLVP